MKDKLLNKSNIYQLKEKNKDNDYNVYVIGDVHEYLGLVVYNLNQIYYKKIYPIDSIFILCGDCGILSEYDIKQLKHYKNNYNYKFYLIRGNHDEIKYFDNRVIGDFVLVEDYTILDNDILCLGGG